MDAEFNMANKYFWRRELAHTEKENEVAPDQYECCKKTKQSMCALIKSSSISRTLYENWKQCFRCCMW